MSNKDLQIEIERECIKDESSDNDNDNDNEELVDELVKNAVKGEVIKANEPTHDLRIEELNKPVRKLTKSEREMIINEFNNGVDNKYYKCHKLKNGSIRITKRSNPLTNDSDDAHETVNKKIDNKLNTKRLTDNQLLLEHIIDLEKRYEVMRMKHKKLKKRYNKLETDLFESDDEELDVREITNNDNAVEPSVDNAIDEPNEPSVEQSNEPIERSVRTVKRPIKKASWRSVITSF